MSVFLSVVLVTSVALAFYHFRGFVKPPRRHRAVVKMLPVLLLAVYGLTAQAPTLLVVALALSALGDLCLAHDGEPPFIAGLSAFLLSHLAYVALFWPIGDAALILASAWRYTVAWVFVVLTTMLLLILWRPVGKLAIPVTVYAVALLAMATTALAIKPPLPSFAAALFVMSDAVLATERFLMKPADPMARTLKPVVWGTYYTAQLLFTLAFAGLPRF